MGKTPKETIRTREQLEKIIDSLWDANDILNFYREIVKSDIVAEFLYDSDVMRVFAERVDGALIERHNLGINDPEYYEDLLI